MGETKVGWWKQGKDVGLAGVGQRGGEKMQTTVIEQQNNLKIEKIKIKQIKNNVDIQKQFVIQCHSLINYN